MRRAGCRWGWHWVSQAENAPHLCPAPAGEPPAFFNVVHTPWLCGTDSRGDLPPLGGLSPLHVLRPPHLAPAAEPLLDSPTCSAATAWSWTRCCCTGRCSSGGACSPATSSQRPSRRRVARLVARVLLRLLLRPATRVLLWQATSSLLRVVLRMVVVVVG